MPVSLYLDVHVDKAIHDQLSLRGVDVLRAQDDDAAEMSDDDLLQRATDLGRVIFTQDIRFKAMAEDWQRLGKSFAGLAFGNQLGITIGAYVKDLELIAKATEPAEWVNKRSEFALQLTRDMSTFDLIDDPFSMPNHASPRPRRRPRLFQIPHNAGGVRPVSAR